MTYYQRGYVLALMAVLCLVLAGTAWAQDQGSQSGPTSAGAAQGQPQGTQAAQPGGQITSVTPAAESEQAPSAPEGTAESFLGVERFSPGSVGGMRNYFIPSFQFSEMADSNFRVSSGPQRYETYSSLVGRLSMQKVGEHSRITADYLGGGLIYTNHSELNTTMHQFGITGVVHGSRWNFLLDDRATYLPESAFGFGGFGWGGSLGSSLGGALGSNLSGLNGNFNPISSLITGRGSQIINTVSTQVGYLVSRRSSLTFAGSFSIQHFQDSGFTNSRSAYFQLGYSHSLTRRDHVGISYGYSQFRYSGGASSFQNHSLQVTYGHQITGKLATSFGAGTQLGVFKNASAGSTTPLSWTANATVNYVARRANLALYYARYTTNGGGVLAGATTDYIQLGVSRGLSRNWSLSLSPGFSRNRSLIQQTGASGGSTYDSASMTGSLSRRLGPFMSMFLQYSYQAQRSTPFSCATGNCGSSLSRNLAVFGFDWHPRQILIN